MSYIGNTSTTQNFTSGTDYFSGNGSTTAYTLSRPVSSINDVIVVVENVVQRPNDAYTISGSTLTFTGIPPVGTNNIYVRYMTTTTQVIAPSQNTVGYSSLNTDLQAATYGMKNRVINGAMVIDQRNNGAATTPSSTGYNLDRWAFELTLASKLTVQQVSDAPSNFNKSLKVTVASTNSISAGDNNQLFHMIEGYNMADLGWGTSAAQSVTLSFWVKSSITGKFSTGIRNAGDSRYYISNYTINYPNTWEQKTITIPGDTGGTWNSTNGRGIMLSWGMGTGSTFEATAGVWGSGVKVSTSDSVDLIAQANGTTWQLTGVQLEKGSTATPFDVRSYNTELTLCQRYYQFFGAIGAAASGSQIHAMARFPVEMRDAPATYGVNPAGGTCVSINRAGFALNSIGGTFHNTKYGCVVFANSGDTGMSVGMVAWVSPDSIFAASEL